MKVIIIDLGAGNIRSLTSSLSYLGADHVVTSNVDEIENATHMILPGVGAFDTAMQAIDNLGLREPLQRYVVEKGMPLLGVCLGMQLLCDSSEEGNLPGLSLMRGRFLKMLSNHNSQKKVPHVGFAPVYNYHESGLFKGIGEKACFYFTHSYGLPMLDKTCNVAMCDHAQPFVAAYQHENICAVQFHPEKSQSTGLRLISNFLELQ